MLFEYIEHRRMKRRIKRSLIKGMSKQGKSIAVGTKKKFDRLQYIVELTNYVFVDGKYFEIVPALTERRFDSLGISYKRNGEFKDAFYHAREKEFIEIPF